MVESAIILGGIDEILVALKKQKEKRNLSYGAVL